MTFDFTDLAFMTGIVAAFSEFLKLIKVRVTWIPIFNMLFGVVLGFIYVSPDDPKQALMAGILIGLSANGLYTGVSIEVGKANKEVGNDPKEKGQIQMNYFYIYNLKQALFFLEQGAAVTDINLNKGKVFHKFERNAQAEAIFTMWCNNKRQEVAILKKKAIQLLEVRKIMALASIMLFLVMSLMGVLQVDFIQTVIITVISFYFGKTTETSKGGSQNETSN